MNISEVLDERQKTHGNFKHHAQVSQELKAVINCYATGLSCVQREALSMICHKIARIVAGNPDYEDHWVDIAGYAQLVVEDLQDE